MPSPIPEPIPFVDLAAQRRRLGGAIDAAIARVAEHSRFVLGPEVEALEAALAGRCGARHAVTCGSGTDALALVLRARGVQPGDAVLVPAFTFAASAEVVAGLGATPVFVDVRPDTFCLDPAGLEAGLAAARRRGLRPVAVMPVDLFGQPADYAAIAPAAEAADLWLLADAAQSFGASFRGRAVGTLGLATAVSFFPSKPLGAFGDGGAVLTDDGELADAVRSLRAHGQGADRYDHVRVGVNSRLDTIQAAILLEKLKLFPDEIAARNRAAARYAAALSHVADVPRVAEGSTSVWAQYTIRVPRHRDALRAHLDRAGVPTAVHYPRPLHHQPAYRDFPTAAGSLAVSENLAAEVLSLPIHGYLTPAVQDRIVAAIRGFAPPA